MPTYYGRKPYIKRSKNSRGKYHDMMRNLTNAQVHQKIIEAWSVFEKPYRTSNYHEMQHFHHSNFRRPHWPGPTDANPVISQNCNGSILDATTAEGDFPSVPCGGNIGLIMGGQDGQGQPWIQDDIAWQFAIPGLAKGSISGNTYTAPSCQSIIDGDCFDTNDNISGYHLGEVTPYGVQQPKESCGFSNIVVSVTQPVECLEDDCLIGTGNIMTSDGADADAPVDGDEYSITGVSDDDITWSISVGSITPGGVVTVTGECGVATITAQMCSETITRDVKMPDGTWVADGTCGQTETGCAQCPTFGVAVDEFSGVYKYHIDGFFDRVCVTPDGSPNNCCDILGAPCVAARAITCPDGSCASPCDTTATKKMWPGVDRFIWECV